MITSPLSLKRLFLDFSRAVFVTHYNPQCQSASAEALKYNEKYIHYKKIVLPTTKTADGLFVFLKEDISGLHKEIVKRTKKQEI